jgi:hypothetical protein
MGWRSATQEFDVLLFTLTVGAFLTRVSVGSEEARLRAGLRPPLNLHVRISRMQLLRRHALARCKKRATSVWTLLASVRLGRAVSILG